MLRSSLARRGVISRVASEKVGGRSRSAVERFNDSQRLLHAAHALWGADHTLLRTLTPNTEQITAVVREGYSRIYIPQISA